MRMARGQEAEAVGPDIQGLTVLLKFDDGFFPQNEHGGVEIPFRMGPARIEDGDAAVFRMKSGKTRKDDELHNRLLKDILKPSRVDTQKHRYQTG